MVTPPKMTTTICLSTEHVPRIYTYIYIYMCIYIYICIHHIYPNGYICNHKYCAHKDRQQTTPEAMESFQTIVDMVLL